MFFKKYLFNDAPAKGWLPWGLLAPVLGLFFVIVTALPSDSLLVALGFMQDDGKFNGITGFLAFLVTSFPALGAVVLLWVKLIERRPLTSVGFVGNRPMKQFGVGQIVGIASSGLVVALIAMAKGYDADQWFVAWRSLSTLGAAALLFLGFSIQSSVEELLFRGWLFSVVTRKFNVFVGIIFSASLFTLLHYSPTTPWYFNINSFLFSVFACYLVLLTNSVWLAMGWHAGWNWFIGVGFEIPITGIAIDIKALVVQLIDIGDPIVTGGENGPENSVMCFMFFIVASIYLHLKVQSNTKGFTHR